MENSDLAPEVTGKVLEDEICRITESLAERPVPRKTGIAQLGSKAAHGVLDSWPLAVALIGTLGILTSLNLMGYGITAHRPPRLSGEEQRERVETVARFAAVEGRAFRQKHGRLPTSQTEIGLSALDDVSFNESEGSDVVAVARAGGIEVRFDSRDATSKTKGEQ